MQDFQVLDALKIVAAMQWPKHSEFVERYYKLGSSIGEGKGLLKNLSGAKKKEKLSEIAELEEQQDDCKDVQFAVFLATALKEYLQDKPAVHQNLTRSKRFKKEIDILQQDASIPAQKRLSRAEIANIINVAPCNVAVLRPCVEEIDERFELKEQQRIVDLVISCFFPPEPKPEVDAPPATVNPAPHVKKRRRSSDGSDAKPT